MMDVRYYPLVRIDTDGNEYQAMTPTDNEETVRTHHRFWLTEVVSDYFRLGTADKPSAAAIETLRPHCPRCGAVLRTVSLITPQHPLPLYACGKCSRRI